MFHYLYPWDYAAGTLIVHEAGGIVTNGMSNADRDGENANSALLVTVSPESPYYLDDPQGCQSLNLEQVLAKAAAGNTKTADQKLQAMIHRMKKKRVMGKQICQAAQYWSAVSIHGDVYPCLMFMDDKEYLMGNIYQNLFEDERWIKLHEAWSSYDKNVKTKCRECPYNRACTSCMGINRFST